VLGNIVFVPPAECAERAAALLSAGAAGVVGGWEDVERMLAVPTHAR
jgi:hypothetical protein